MLDGLDGARIARQAGGVIDPGDVPDRGGNLDAAEV
jgi:hypothetical protein